MGHNNWVFFGSDQGGKTAAVLRSFVASCQRVGVEPFAWLKDVLSRIADHPISRLAELLPHNWAPAQAQLFDPSQIGAPALRGAGDSRTLTIC